MNGSKQGWTYPAGVTVAVLASFLTIWTTIVRDDGSGAGFLMIILAAGVGGFAAGFRAAGMARAMLGIAVMQAMLGILTATAPVTAMTPDGPFRALLFNGIFALLWLVSAACFRAASKRRDPVAAS